MSNKLLFFVLLVTLFPIDFSSSAEGISVDAGLTPGQDRIIVRLQYRNLIRTMDGNDVVIHVIPMVVVYGLSPDLTLMMRNGYRAVGTNKTMLIMEDQWLDPFFMGKVKLFRHNALNYTFGLAGFAGTTFPVWNSSALKTYSPVMGLNASLRPNFWSFDLNSAYEWSNYNTSQKRSETRQLQLNLAISRNVIFPGTENWVLAPVQEFSFVRNYPVSGDANSFGFLSPGIQIVSPYLKIEGLYQIALNSSQSTGPKNGNRLILGLRLLF